MHFASITFSLILLPFIQSLKCPDSSPNVVQLPTGQCFYLENRTFIKVTREEAENECAMLGEGDYRWYLPKLDNVTKDQFLIDSIKNVTNLTHWMLWVGIYRDAPINNLEPYNTTQWADKTKWRWSIDGTTLESSFPTTRPPWLPGEPTNTEFVKNTKKVADLERCVVAERNKNRNFTIPRWYDMCCEIRAQHFLQMFLEDYVLVCESVTVSSAAEAQAIKNRPTSDHNGKSGWRWLFLGMVLGATLGASVMLGAFYFKKKQSRRKNDKDEITIAYRGGGSTDGQQQAMSWANDIVTDDRQKFF